MGRAILKCKRIRKKEKKEQSKSEERRKGKKEVEKKGRGKSKRARDNNNCSEFFWMANIKKLRGVGWLVDMCGRRLAPHFSPAAIAAVTPSPARWWMNAYNFLAGSSPISFFISSCDMAHNCSRFSTALMMIR